MHYRRVDLWHRSKDLGDLFLAVAKDFFKVTSHKKLMHQSSSDWLVDDLVFYKRSVFGFLESVFVVPKVVRAFQLSVDESVRRLPHCNFSTPFDWNFVNADLVVQYKRAFISTGIGVRILKFKIGGVIRSSCFASAKNSKTVSSGCSTSISARSQYPLSLSCPNSIIKSIPCRSKLLVEC